MIYFHFFTCAAQFSQHHLLKRLSLPPLYILASFVKNKVPIGAWVYLQAILFHWYIFLFCVCQNHTVLMTVALQYNLKSGRLIPPTPFFFFYFLKTALDIQCLLCFQINCEIFCSISVENVIGNLIEIALNLQIVFGNIVIFIILILPTKEHGYLSIFICHF